MMDGMGYDQASMDTAMQPAPAIEQAQQDHQFSGAGTEMPESIMRDRMMDLDQPPRPLESRDGQTLGSFPFDKQ
jgi:hypothetical protein